MSDKFDMTFALFPNRKPKGPNSPKWTGNVTVGGKKFWLSAWENNKGDMDYISGKVQDPDDESWKREEPRRSEPEMSQEIKDVLNDDIPF